MHVAPRERPSIRGFSHPTAFARRPRNRGCPCGIGDFWSCLVSHEVARADRGLRRRCYHSALPQCSARSRSQDVDLAQHAQAVSAMVRVASRLGVRRVPRDVTPDPLDYARDASEALE
jgi:hypothetical protein